MPPKKRSLKSGQLQCDPADLSSAELVQQHIGRAGVVHLTAADQEAATSAHELEYIVVVKAVDVLLSQLISGEEGLLCYIAESAAKYHRQLLGVEYPVADSTGDSQVLAHS